VQESSFDAWTKFYKQDENAPNSIVSYYAKGALIALTLDLKIRRDSSDEKSLDDVMRALWLEYGKPDIGLGEADIEALIVEVTDLDLTQFFDSALRSVNDLPMEDLLRSVAVGYELHPAADSSDKGGIRKESSDLSQSKPDLSVLHRSDALGVKLTSVLDYGAALEAGLSAGDIIIALDGIKVTSGNYDQILARQRIGDVLEVHAFRRDELMQFQVVMQAAQPNTCGLWRMLDMDAGQQRRQQDWLRLTSRE